MKASPLLTVRSPALSEGRNRYVLARFRNAWAAADMQAMAACLHEEICYAPSLGPSPDHAWRGKREVLEGIGKMIAHDNATARVEIVISSADHILTRWCYYEKASGRLLARGCDIFTFKDGLILKKDAYRKCKHEL